MARQEWLYKACSEDSMGALGMGVRCFVQLMALCGIMGFGKVIMLYEISTMGKKV